jgi:hypothetical protein
MNNANALLPSGFENLDRFVESWAIAGSANRLQRRLESSDAERVEFFNAAKDMAAPALELLDRKPLDQFDGKENRLMDLMLTLAHVSLAVEVQADAEPKHAALAKYITIKKSTADLAS